MVSMSPNISLKTEMKGGFLASLGRSVLGGESFFISRFVAQSGPGDLTLGPSLPGDISAFNLQGHTFYVQSGSYLAAGPGITVDSKFAGARGFFSGERLVGECTGPGTLYIQTRSQQAFLNWLIPKLPKRGD